MASRWSTSFQQLGDDSGCVLVAGLREALEPLRVLALDADMARDAVHRLRCVAAVDGGNDLGVVDPLQIDGRDARIAVPQLPLDDVERDALVGQLDGVGMAQLVGANRRRTPAFEATRRSWARAESLAR
jgi:hypothetical protein